MNVRLISGKYGGRIIQGSGTDKTHPMGERVRNALFNKLGDAVEGAVVLDAFAGSGAIGLEALSRGAKTATFIEKDRVAQKIIEDNIKLVGAQDDASLIRTGVSQYLSTAKQEYDIIFVDPPYDDPQLSTAMQLLGLLKPNGLMVLSYPGKGEIPAELGVVVVDNRSYGNANLVFYRKESV